MALSVLIRLADKAVQQVSLVHTPHDPRIDWAQWRADLGVAREATHPALHVLHAHEAFDVRCKDARRAKDGADEGYGATQAAEGAGLYGRGD